ncbi:MAG: hypothetical protein NT154_34955 [Verrucomicrobia bacterium]|nr:hypothetical protein [Verrucomicrobiota bacterium]
MQTISHNLLLTIGFTLSVNLAYPQARVYTLDPNQSALSISGNIIGYTMTQQAPGSLTTKFGGTIQATVVGNTIQFAGLSLVEAQDSGSWQPKGDGTAGSESANFGAQASSFFASAKAALRKIQLDVISSALTMNNGQFDSRGLTFLFPSNAPSTFCYAVTGALSKNGFEPLGGYATNTIATLSSLTTSGTQQTLTIPVDATFVLSLLSPNDSSFTVKGQLVASTSASVPLTVQSIQVQHQVVSMQWQSQPGQQFQVQSSPNLQSWQTTASNITSSTTAYTWSGPATAPTQFFRLAK